MNFFQFTYDRKLADNYVQVIRNDGDNYISSKYVINKIFDLYNVQIGYYTINSIVQQIPGEKSFYITENTTYYINGNGNISGIYHYTSDTNSAIFTPGNTYATEIICPGGEYFGKKGAISIEPNEDGTRLVSVSLNIV